MKFEDVEQLPPDPILGVTASFKVDPRSKKVNLGVGAYRTDQGKPYTFETVKAAEKTLLGLDKEYLPIRGNQDFCKAVSHYLFDAPPPLAMAQSVGGTGALRVAGEFLRKTFKNIYLPDPTWVNHKQIFEAVGLECRFYSHGDTILDNIPKGSAILFHTSCHNPTGIELTMDQWHSLAHNVKERGLYPVFDSAYLGFSSALTPFHLFEEMVITVTFSKTMGLYGERVGWLGITTDAALIPPIESHLEAIIRTLYSSPPTHGARIVTEVLNNHQEAWEKELLGIRTRIDEMRAAFADSLGLPHLKLERGMFSILNISKEQVDKLIKEYGIYMPQSGRINFAGLTRENLPYVAEAFKNL